MKVIPFTRYRFLMMAVSLVLIAGFWGGTYLQGGFNLGVDFQAGLNVTVRVDGGAEIAEVRDSLTGLGDVRVQTAGAADSGLFMIRLGDEAGNDSFQTEAQGEILDRLSGAFGRVELESAEFVGARFAGSLAGQTVMLTAVAMALILVYIWVRFRLNYAVSAILAVIHDALFLAGFIGVLQLEFSTASIAALLTIIGYSLNDTIVIFDRIRENSRILKDTEFEELVNVSLTQSMSRTLITSLTTLIAVTAIYVFGIGTIRIFAMQLIVGVIIGTFSSIFIASTVLLGWHDARAARTRKVVQGTPRLEVASQAAVSAAPRRTETPAPVAQTAEEIAAATAARAKSRAKRRKKKK